MIRLFLILLAAGTLLTGCKGKCRLLSEKLCECSVNTTEKDSCLRRAASAEGVNPPTRDDETRCFDLYAGCDCHLIDTPEGKVKCGLARAK